MNVMTVMAVLRYYRDAAAPTHPGLPAGPGALTENRIPPSQGVRMIHRCGRQFHPLVGMLLPGE